LGHLCSFGNAKGDRPWPNPHIIKSYELLKSAYLSKQKLEFAAYQALAKTAT